MILGGDWAQPVNPQQDRYTARHAVAIGGKNNVELIGLSVPAQLRIHGCNIIQNISIIGYKRAVILIAVGYNLYSYWL